MGVSGQETALVREAFAGVVGGLSSVVAQQAGERGAWGVGATIGTTPERNMDPPSTPELEP